MTDKKNQMAICRGIADPDKGRRSHAKPLATESLVHTRTTSMDADFAEQDPRVNGTGISGIDQLVVAGACHGHSSLYKQCRLVGLLHSEDQEEV